MDDLDKLMANLSPDEQGEVHRHAKKMRAAISLRELRTLAGKTQRDVSAGTGMEQNNVSRLEKGGDMKLSTLRDYVESLGGSLQIVADLSGNKVDLSSIARTSRKRLSKIRFMQKQQEGLWC